jgi:hypothetical protein
LHSARVTSLKLLRGIGLRPTARLYRSRRVAPPSDTVGWLIQHRVLYAQNLRIQAITRVAFLGSVFLLTCIIASHFYVQIGTFCAVYVVVEVVHFEQATMQARRSLRLLREVNRRSKVPAPPRAGVVPGPLAVDVGFGVGIGPFQASLGEATGPAEGGKVHFLEDKAIDVVMGVDIPIARDQVTRGPRNE